MVSPLKFDLDNNELQIGAVYSNKNKRYFLIIKINCVSIEYLILQ